MSDRQARDSGTDATDPSPGTSPERRHLLLTGRPGVGKTTVVQRLADRLATGTAGGGAPLRVAGFCTEEIREDEERQGFRAIPLSGDEDRVIAHREIEDGPRVGAYGVDVEAVEAVVEATLGPDREADVWIVDEIGKMECLSDGFVEALERLLGGPGPVVATVGAGGTDFMAGVRRRADAQLWRVTEDNRDRLPARMEREVRKLAGPDDS